MIYPGFVLVTYIQSPSHLLEPSHGLLRMTSAYCLLHWISRVQVADSSPLRWVKNWPSACLELFFCRCQQVRHYLGQLGILSFLECQQSPSNMLEIFLIFDFVHPKSTPCRPLDKPPLPNVYNSSYKPRRRQHLV